MNRSNFLEARSSDDRAVICYDREAGLVVVSYSGEVTQESLSNAHKALLTLVADDRVNAVVLDSSAVIARYTPAELIEALETCLSIAKPTRCAMVLGSGSHEDALMLVETVCFNYGTKVQAFAGLEEAQSWARDA